MDDKKGKVSVKINGKETEFKEVKTTNNQAEIPEFKIEKNKDNIIDFQKKKKEKGNRQPFWDDGNHETIPKIPYKKRKKKRNDRLKYSFRDLPIKLIAAGISAIIVGLSLGITILTLMTAPQEANTARVEMLEEKNAPLEDLSVYIVQGGAFSNFEKGKEMAAVMQNRGQAGVLVSDSEKYMLFIGLGSTKKEAEKISSIYTDDGFETYVKAYQVNGGAINIKEEAAKYINEGVKYHKQLTNMTVTAFDTPSVVGDELFSQIKNWANDQEALKEIEKESQNKASEFISHLQKSVELFEQYQKEQNEDFLWQTQQKLLEGIAGYEQLLETFR